MAEPVARRLPLEDSAPARLPRRARSVFAILVLAQAAHSVEEYLGRLWETFPPARFLTGLLSPNLETGFLVINVGLVAFGVWCLAWPVRRGWAIGRTLAWIWVIIQLINGIGHPLWSILNRGYTPGVATAPLLLLLALLLLRDLRAPQRA